MENLSYSYGDGGNEKPKHPAVSGISLEIGEGEYLAVIGRNGSGKSTFAKLLNLILDPTDGKIYISGKDVTSPDMTDEDVYAVRRDIGMVFQNPDNQLVATMVEDDVAFGPENLGLPREELRKRVDDALAAVGMTEFAGYEPHRLSGGQKQRVAIAGIIAMLPRCIIFDESTAMLDPIGRRDTVEMMEKLNREKGITVITITHYMDEAVRADRVIVMDNGRVLADGTPKQVYSDRELILSAGLELPQCATLVDRLRTAGVNIPDGDSTTPEKCAELIASALKGGELS